jgi:hypothetical protein
MMDSVNLRYDRQLPHAQDRGMEQSRQQGLRLDIPSDEVKDGTNSELMKECACNEVAILRRPLIHSKLVGNDPYP